MSSQIAIKYQNLTTAEEMQNHTKLIMQPCANWEEYLAPAPLSIAILGELVFISSETDFSINKNPPKDGYKFIRYPDSFRACLMQVCNSGWRAFNEAHKNMDQIRLHTLMVPDYMKNAVRILFQANDEIVQALLPQQLENIHVIADDCLALADGTEKKFSDVINIIQELLEACVNAKQLYGEELDAIKKEKIKAEMQKVSKENAVKNFKKVVDAMDEELTKARENYNKAIDSLPSGWEMIGMDFVGALTDNVTYLINGLTNVLIEQTKRYGSTAIPKMMSNIPLHSMSNIPDESAADKITEISIFCKSSEILKCTDVIQQFVKENEIDWKDLYDQKNKTTKTDFSMQQFKRIISEIEQFPECKPKNQVKKICDDGIKICEELAKHAPDGKTEEDKTQELINKITSLTESARIFDTKSKRFTNYTAMIPKPPMMVNTERSENMRPSQWESFNARFRIEQSRLQLNNIKEAYEKSVENMEKNQKELTEILITMRNCKVKEIDFNTTIKMLVKGIDAMGRVKEQWEKMVHFFQMVSNIVKTCLTRTLKDFITTSAKTEKLSYSSKLFSKDLLYSQAVQATNISSLIHMISATYTEVSSKHLMDQVSSLGKLMTMDPEKPQFEHEHLQLQNSCDEAQKAILLLVIQNKEEFKRKTNARVEKIDKELLAILPPASPKEINEIKEVVNKGFTEGNKSIST